MSPLAKEIYRRLLQQLRSNKRSITYAELAVQVSRKIPTHQRSAKLHAALGEVSELCRANDLPCLPAIVWSRATRRPSAGYYKVAHPRARTEAARRAAWEREHEHVVSTAASYPVTL